MPDMKGKKPMVNATMADGIEDVANSAGKMNADYEKSLADLEDDDEMQKWMAKQRG